MLSRLVIPAVLAGVAITVLCYGNSMEAHAQAPVPGTAWAKREFSTDGPLINRAVGSYTQFEFKNLLVNTGLQSIQMRLDVATSAQPYGPYGVMILMMNPGPTKTDCSSVNGHSVWETLIPGSTGMSLWVNVAGVTGTISSNSSSQTWVNSTNPVKERGFLRLAMFKNHSCLLHCPIGIDSVGWSWKGGTITSSGTEYPIPMWPVSRIFANQYPTYVKIARHGIASQDTNTRNDIYVDFYLNGSYTPIACSDETGSGCTGGYYWNPGEETRWPSAGEEAPPPPAPIQIFTSTPAQGADSKSICLGSVQGTPCGCYACGSPAWNDQGSPPAYIRFDKRSANEEGYPIRWFFDASSWPDPNDATSWRTDFVVASEEYNNRLGVNMLCQTNTLADADIVVSGFQLPAGTNGLTTLPQPTTVLAYSAHCSDPGLSGVSYWLIREDIPITIQIQTDATDVTWTDHSLFTADGADPGQPRLCWRFRVAIHELGHALGLNHDTTIPTQPSNPVYRPDGSETLDRLFMVGIGAVRKG